ncbi:MAG: hypothetical protein HC892_18735 [Saprospiraceae bacterium]|nr:hypothetical protein [Saprospiraceae bacterium]
MGSGICKATVQLKDSVGNLFTTLTDDNGNYQFSNLPTNENYIVNVEKVNASLDGISTFDFLLINKHILGELVIQNPFSLYALDVDNSKSLTVMDLSLLRRVILNIPIPISINRWLFFNSNYVFPDPMMPWNYPDATVRAYRNLTESIENANFIGNKIGDANNSANSCEN